MPRRVRAARQKRQHQAIEPTRLYTQGQAARLLRMRPTRFRELVRAGKVRVKVDGSRHLHLGQWLIDWLERAEP